jgi:hypothetical protein
LHGKINVGRKYKKLLIFIDSCAGQNKKNFVAMSHFTFMVEQQWFEEIEHHLLVLGNTFLPCDADFGVTEKLKRKTQCFHTTRLDRPYKMLL